MSSNSPTIGLALSGGGSRAIAFHLGCLRALNELGLLSNIKALSAVSGGSVIGAYYAHHPGPFETFENDVVSILKRGLHRDILLACLSPQQLARTVVTSIISGTTATIAAGLALSASAGGRALGLNPRTAARIPRLRAPLRRWASRTTAFSNALDNRFFHGRRMNDRPRGNFELVINASELKTGTAFRFGSKESGCWRYGRLATNDIKLSDAVAASTAYPAFLPALDLDLRFLRRDGRTVVDRVVLSDGGIFENSGVSCFDPDRSPEHSYNVFPVDYIVGCDAGTGQMSEGEAPYGWASRMRRSFETVYRKGTDASRSRLHHLASSRKIKGFVLPYLGQVDRKLPAPIPDLVSREEVVNYPTDFAAMPPEWIEKLSLRGEQLTRLLVATWCRDLLAGSA